MLLRPLTPFAPPFSIPFPIHNSNSNTHFFPFPQTRNPLTLISKPQPSTPIQCTSSSIDIDLVRNEDGTYAPKRNKVVVLWDLDNKPPRGPPFDAALSLKRLASRFGDILDFSAYANRHAFIHLPERVLQERRERRRLDILERKGEIVPDQPYVCSVCGRKCKANLDLKKHFVQLHERERQKKLTRMRQLKGKKRQKFKERYIANNHKFEEAARELIKPKSGYGLERELRRAGVYVKTVEDKPQAADWALKRQMLHSMSRGVDWLFLVSDDSDFVDMLARAREANLGTVVVGDVDRSLGRNADLWVPWSGVEKGELRDENLVSRRRIWVGVGDVLYSVSGYEEGEFVGCELDGVVSELVGARVQVFRRFQRRSFMNRLTMKVIMHLTQKKRMIIFDITKCTG